MSFYFSGFIAATALIIYILVEHYKNVHNSYIREEPLDIGDLCALVIIPFGTWLSVVLILGVFVYVKYTTKIEKENNND